MNVGSVTSHTAILAQSMKIPVVLCLINITKILQNGKKNERQARIIVLTFDIGGNNN